MLENKSNSFAYIKPLEFPRIVWRLIKRVAKFIYDKVMGPMFKAGKGAAHYFKIFFDKTKTFFKIIFTKTSYGIRKLAKSVYNFVKGILLALWKGFTFAFDLLIVKVLMSILSAYFWLFETLLK